MSRLHRRDGPAHPEHAHPGHREGPGIPRERHAIEIALAEQGIPSVGIWAQVPHYVHGTYFPGALALVERAAGYLGVRLPLNSLVDLAREERARLDTVVASRPEASAYLDQLESTGPVPPLPPGEDIADELERFLREATGDSRNPFEDPGDETP